MRTLLTTVFILTFFVSFSQNYQWDCAERGGTSTDVIIATASRDHDHEHILDIAVDVNNNYYYLALSMYANESIGMQPYTSYGTNRTQDLVLFSTDCTGNFRWSKTFGGGMDVYGGGLETDALGGVYVSGIVQGRNDPNQPSMQFDTDFSYDPNAIISTNGSHNKSLFIIKYDISGSFQWLELPQMDNLDFGVDAFSFNWGLVVEDDGTITVQTLFAPGTHFNGNIVVPSPYKGLVIQMNKDGNYLNHFAFDVGGEITFDRNVTYHYDPLNGQHYFGLHRRIGGGNVVSFNNVQQTGFALIVALDATGTELWRYDSSGVADIKSIVTDDQSNVYLSGASNNVGNVGTDNFAGHTFDQLSSPTSQGGGVASFTIKLNTNGVYQWGTNATYSTGTISTGYAVVVNGNEVAMGTSMINTNTWDGATFTRPFGSAQDPVVVRMDKNTGSVIAIEDVEGPYGFNDEVTALAVDNFGNYVVGGYVTNSLFANDPNVSIITNSGGDSDFWFARLAKTDCNGVPLSNGDIKEQSFKIFPNPANDYITILSTTSVTVESYQLYNLTGQLVQEGQPVNRRVDISDLTTGIYLIKVNAENSQSNTLKLVKE